MNNKLNNNYITGGGTGYGTETLNTPNIKCFNDDIDYLN